MRATFKTVTKWMDRSTLLVGTEDNPNDKQEASDTPERTPEERKALVFLRLRAQTRPREELRTHVPQLYPLHSESLHRETHQALPAHVML